LPVEHPTNRVLAALALVDPRDGWAHLERVELRPGHSLLEPNTPIQFMYFPEDALVGLLHADGQADAAVPLALVGNDGVVGAAPFFGAQSDRFRAQVLHPGRAWRLATEAVRQGPPPDEGQLKVVLRYVQALNEQMSQTALCRLRHTLIQRLCRWLQSAFDRVPGTVLHIEPAVLAAWVGAAPDAVAQASAQLVDEGAVSYQQGVITLLHRPLLARHACGCCQQEREQTGRLSLPCT